MPYCGNFLFQEVRNEEDNFPGYVPCVPRDQSLPVDRNFPQGRFTKHTAKSKDAWVELAVNAWRIRREMAETDEGDMDDVVDEYVEERDEATFLQHARSLSGEYYCGASSLRSSFGRSARCYRSYSLTPF